MTPDERKSAYDELLADAKRVSGEASVPEGDEFSLEGILAEYGGGRRRKILDEVERRTDGVSADRPAPSRTVSPEKTAPAAGTAEPPAGESTSAAPPAVPAEKPGEPAPTPASSPAREQPPEQTPPQAGSVLTDDEDELSDMDEADDPAEAEEGGKLPPPPRPIPMEEVVGRTVDAVMEEQEVLLPEKKHRRGLFSRKRLDSDTEELYQRPEKAPEDDSEPESEPEPPDEPEPIGPEPPLEELAGEGREDWKRMERPLPAAAVLTAALTVLLAAGEQGKSLPLWDGSLAVQTGVLLSVLAVVSLLCRKVFVRGFRLLARRRCCGELAAALSALAAAADCAARPFLSGRTPAAPYALCACAALVFAQWGMAREARARYDMYRTAALTARPPYLVTDTPKGACKQEGRIEGFYTDAVRDDLPLRWQTALLPVILMGCVVFAGLASFGQGNGENFLLCLSAMLSASASLALPLCWSLPWSRLSRQLQRSGCAVAGWGGAEAISRQRAMILTDADLFPPGAVRLNGIKVFGEELPHAVSYAASLVRASGSGLARLFDGLVRSEGGHYCEVEDFSFYEEGGYSARIRGESVLLGTASFLRKMEVRLPGNLNLRTGLFLAVDRQLTAVFAVKYGAAENVDWALRMLRRSRITPILAARDVNITPALVKRKFNRRVRVQYPPLAARLALSEQEEGRGRPRALLLREGLAPYAETVAGSRRLTQAVRRSAGLSILGSAAGTLLAFYLSFQGTFSLMTPVTLLAFLLLWVLPTLLLSGWTGHC